MNTKFASTYVNKFHNSVCGANYISVFLENCIARLRHKKQIFSYNKKDLTKSNVMTALVVSILFGYLGWLYYNVQKVKEITTYKKRKKFLS